MKPPATKYQTTIRTSDGHEVVLFHEREIDDAEKRELEAMTQSEIMALLFTIGWNEVD